MARNVRVKVHGDAIRELLTSPAAEAMLAARAAAVASASNSQSSWGGYRSASERGQLRARAVVFNISRNGRRDESRNNRMIRNLQAGS